MTDSFRILIHTKQPNTKAQPEQQKQQHQLGFHALTTETTQVLEYSYSNFTIKQQHRQLNQAAICATVQQNICTWLANFAVNFVHFIHHQFCTLHQSPACTWVAEQSRTFHPSLYASVTCNKEFSYMLFLLKLYPHDVTLWIYTKTGKIVVRLERG